MKKIIALLLAALLAFAGAACAETLTEENAVLTYEELEMYLDSLRAAILAEGKENVSSEQAEACVQISAPQAVITIADETLRDSSAVLSAVLAPGQACPRGIQIGDSLESVLSVYPNDNPTLLGSYYDAALFVAGENPEASAGWALRDGQRVTEVVYAVYHWMAEGVISCGIRYTLDQGLVTGIEIFGMDQVVTEDEALASLNEVAVMQETTEYFAYPQSADGTTLAAFDREDLIFGGLDLLGLTMEDAIAALGEANVDEWAQDESDGGYLRTRQWEDVSAVFLYDADKKFLRLDNLSITGESLDGPRGVRVGDRMETVINRFRHEETQMMENGTLLYGDGENAPYGILSHGDVTTTLTYTAALPDGQIALWQGTFVEGELQEMRILLR